MPLARLLQSALAFLVLFVPLVWAANEEAIEARMRADVAYLASDDLEGRGIETKGIELAADYIARKFAEAGLVPGGSDGWYQSFLVHGAAKLDAPGKVTLHGPLGQTIALKPGVDFEVMGLSGATTVNAPLVFAGHGAVAKEIGYDDYKDLDVAGKVAVVLRHTPRWNNKELPFDGPRAGEHAELPKKQALAESRKAAAVIVVNDITEEAGGDKLMTFDYLKSAAASSIPAIHLRRAVLDMIFQSSLGTSLKEMEQAIDRDLKPRGAPLVGWTATIETAVSRTTIPVKNVVGVLDGSGPLAKETIVIGAHYDHLGYGGRGSRAKDPKKKEIHNGADDNASGTTALIELARRFGAMKDRQGRRLVFIAFSAEETGLLGSQHYCNKEPLFPLETTAAMVNLDMVGRLRPDQKTGRDRLIVEGVGTAKGFEGLVDKLNPGFTFVKHKGGLGASFGGSSDHESFYRQKVPILFFWTGTHDEYHLPTDDTETINVAGMRRIADFAEKVVAQLAADPQRPQYVHIASKIKAPAGGGPRLGIMPNYDEAKPGLLVGGVTDGGPAAKGGVKAGDLIVQIAGRPVTNIETYMVIMADQRAGRPLDIVILRGKDKVKLKVTP